MAVAARSLFEAPLERPALAEGIFFDRNWHLAQDMIWSRDTDASINVLAEILPEPVELVMTFSVFNASAETPKTLLVESPGHEPIELVITTPAPCSVVVRTPIHQSEVTYSPMYLRLDSLDSPAKLGQSVDDRLLGLHIHSLSPETPVLSFPLDFTDAKTCETVLREGWAPPEPETGTWSLGHHARLVLPGYLFSDDNVELAFEATTLPRPEDMEALEVKVESGSVVLANWYIRSVQSRESCRCPLPKGEKYTDREVTLTIHGAVPPMALGINLDPRDLGILLKEIGTNPTVKT